MIDDMMTPSLPRIYDVMKRYQHDADRYVADALNAIGIPKDYRHDVRYACHSDQHRSETIARLRFLLALDIGAVRNAVDAAHAKAHAEMAATLVACEACKSIVAYGDVSMPTAPDGSSLPVFVQCCAACRTRIEARYARECAVCGIVFRAVRSTFPLELCATHATDACIAESKRVRDHNERASRLGQPASLTLREWLATLEHFAWVCAYCGGSFECLEHLETVQRAGTTASNCVPSCHRCNMRKGNKTYSSLRRVFGAETMDRVESWRGQRAADEALERRGQRSKETT